MNTFRQAPQSGNRFTRTSGPRKEGGFSRGPARSTGGSSSGRPSYRGGSSGSSSGQSSFRYSPRPSSGGGSRGPSRYGNKPKRKTDYIDENLFINKATPLTAEAPYVSTNTFQDFNVAPQLAKNIAAKGFIHPSPIQDQSIPVALTGKDVIGIANTGTGKTAAFLIPIINSLVINRDQKAMVLTPTRELAQQIEAEFRSLTHGMRFWSVVVVGGMPIMRQIRLLEMGVQIVIGTPGRVKDLIARRKIDMSQFKTIVLDEADRMLDMGFIGDMREILGGMPKERQSMFFSATFSPEIKNLCKDFLREPVTVSIKTRDTASSIDQDVIRVSHHSEKLDKLHEILNQPELKKVLIFRETKRHTDELARELKARGFNVSALHGDMRNRERSRAVDALAKGELQVVVATDVAARGIDIPDITHVINYDIPSTYDTYIHRIGRTGRASKKGIALTFVR